MSRTRLRGAVVAAGAAIASVLGFAAPAHANFAIEPVSLAWHPAGAVHSSVSFGGIVYLGGKLDGTGGVAAVDASTGALLWQVPANNDVRALALSPDGAKLYAGGNFSTVGGVTHRHLVALNVADHTIDTSWKASANGTVRDLIARGGTVYAAGLFSSIDGVTQRGIGAVDAMTGARDASFAISADDNVLGMATTGNLLIISGAFWHINGVARSKLASIDLTTNTLTSWAPAWLCSGCDQYWDVQTDGTNAYIGTSGSGGNFGAFNLTTALQPWRYSHADGDVQSVWLPGDGKVYVGGHFGASIYQVGNSQHPASVTNVAAIDLATGQPDPSFNPFIYKHYPGVWTFTSTQDRLWVGGDFTGERQSGTNNHQPYLAAYPGA